MDDCRRLLSSKPDGDWPKLRTDPRCVDDQGNPTEEFRQLLQRVGENAFSQKAAESYWNRGVTCFSETPDSTLLWSHYGGSHRGLCLEFDPSAPALGKLHKVRYTDEIPTLNTVDELVDEASAIMWLFLVKAACWSYEREWRAIHEEAEKEYCYGVEGLTGVYLGAQLTSAERDLVCHILHGSNTKIYQMSRGEASMKLEARAVTYTPYAYPEQSA